MTLTNRGRSRGRRDSSGLPVTRASGDQYTFSFFFFCGRPAAAVLIAVSNEGLLQETARGPPCPSAGRQEDGVIQGG